MPIYEYICTKCRHEFEELILLVVATLKEEGAYAVLIKRELDQQSGRGTNISAVHTTLYRLEEKGLLKSKIGGSTKERGGRSKRFFSLTAAGKQALYQVQTLRHQLWGKASELKIKLTL